MVIDDSSLSIHLARGTHPVAVTLAIFAYKEAFLLKVDGESFYRGEGLSDGRLQGLLRDVRILSDSFENGQFFQRAIQSVKLRL